MENPSPQLLNVGCGRHFHPAWRNLDVVSFDPQVEACDLRRGLPADENRYDMVYHSHVLEHLSPSDGRRLIAECWRVLKPQGILRIVVPDLEQITRLYLLHLEQAWQATQESPIAKEAHAETVAKYEWMTMELLDQMVRQQSGGNMGKAMQAATGSVAKFIDSRLGREVQYAKSASGPPPPAPATKAAWRVRLTHRLLRWLLGKQAVQWLQVGEFLDCGEVHRWMYDRFSLQQLCVAQGFKEFRIMAAHESYLPSYSSFGLDVVDGMVRKPDSLFIECVKPS